VIRASTFTTGPAAMLLATLLFALMAVFIKSASAEFGVGEIVFYRSVVTALLSWVAARRAGDTLRTRLAWAQWRQAAVGAAVLGLYFFSLTQLPLATAVTLNYASSIWLTLMLVANAAALGQARVGPLSLAAVAMGFVGVVMVLQPTFVSGQGVAATCGLLSGGLAALGYLLLAQLTRAGEPSHRVVFYASLGACAAGMGLAVSGGWHALSWNGLGRLAAVGLLGAGGQLLLARAFGSGDTVVTASLQYAGVAYALVLGGLVFGDSLSATSLMGIAIIVMAALACIQVRRHAPAS
jgi:S-adenosylmethionine uptake transporter